MDLKQIAIKAAKGAFSAALGAAAVAFTAGIPLTRHGWLAALGVIGGAAFHAGWDAISQVTGA